MKALDFCISTPLNFYLLKEKLTLEEANYIINKTSYVFFASCVPIKLVNIFSLNKDLIKIYIENNLLDFFQILLNGYNEINSDKDKIAFLINILKELDDYTLKMFFIKKINLDVCIDDIKDEDYIKNKFIKNPLYKYDFKYLRYIRNLNNYIDFIIENQLKIDKDIFIFSNLNNLTEENLIKLFESNFFVKRLNTDKNILVDLYEALLKINPKYKDLIVKNIIENKLFSIISLSYRIFYRLELSDFNTLFNSNPTRGSYLIIHDRILKHNKDFKFDNIKALEYDINNIIRFDKKIIYDNYETIKNYILRMGCGKSNLKRFLKINKNQLTEDIIKYGFIKVPLFTSVLLNKDIPNNINTQNNTINYNLNSLVYKTTMLTENEKKFLENNLELKNYDIYKINHFSKELLSKKIEELRKTRN